jgi:hypothetical protein
MCAYHVIDGVVDGLDDLFVPVLVVFNSKENVVHIDCAIKFFWPGNNLPHISGNTIKDSYFCIELY